MQRYTCEICSASYVFKSQGGMTRKLCMNCKATCRRKALKEKGVQYKGSKCEHCGYDKCIAAMDFHHRDPTQKDFSISQKKYGWDKIKPELDKCILLCKNCHAELHYSSNLLFDN